VPKAPSEIEVAPPRLGDVDFADGKIDDKHAYEKKLKLAQEQMLQIQQAYHRQGRRGILVFEGWDASGKGGAIKRLTARLDPRGYAVHPIGIPNSEEQSRHYLYRFFRSLPPAGRIAIFDRSWYGRVLVERIEGLAPENDWRRAYREITDFERMLTDDGVRIVKFFLHISKEDQLKRFRSRFKNPAKQWKLTVEDLRNREKWSLYETAIDEMFARTSTTSAPWTLIPARDKRYARVAVLQAATEALGDGVDIEFPGLDPGLAKIAEAELGLKP
jgi:polyphosphate kinase 2 (PPK2 family)